MFYVVIAIDHSCKACCTEACCYERQPFELFLFLGRYLELFHIYVLDVPIIFYEECAGAIAGIFFESWAFGQSVDKLFKQLPQVLPVPHE